MEPRKSRSKKWTPLPKELLGQIHQIFNETFSDQIGDGKFLADGRIYPDEILVCVGYLAKGALKQNNFEVSVEYSAPKDNVLKLIHLAVDAAGSLFEQIFVADDQDFPRIWQEFNFEGRKIFAQYTTANHALEQAADQLLGKSTSDDELTQGDWTDEPEISPESIKASLGVLSDDDEDTN